MLVVHIVTTVLYWFIFSPRSFYFISVHSLLINTNTNSMLHLVYAHVLAQYVHAFFAAVGKDAGEGIANSVGSRGVSCCKMRINRL